MRSSAKWQLLLSMTIALIVSATLSRLSAQERLRNDVPSHSTPQNLPCVDQPKSLKELTNAFSSGTMPSSSDMTGTWVAISSFIDTYDSTMNCMGLKRGTQIYEEVIIANGYSLELHVVGTSIQRLVAKRDTTNSLRFPFDFGGDSNPVFRCRLTTRKTLACLIDVYRQGIEFKRIPAKPDEMATTFEFR